MAHNSYTMCTRVMSDMYTLSPRVCGPQASGVHISRALGVHIRQNTHAHGITITYRYVNCDIYIVPSWTIAIEYLLHTVIMYRSYGIHTVCS